MLPQPQMEAPPDKQPVLYTTPIFVLNRPKPMDAFLSRVGDAELRQHCVNTVLDELEQADKQVRGVVSALERALKVAQASRDLHKSLVLNGSPQVQASFRQLGDSCNQIGPLRRPNEPASSETTTSEYELSSDAEHDDDDPEVVEVARPKRSKKRKVATVDLSGSTPAVRVKTLQGDTQTVRGQVAVELRKIREIPADGYAVATHKELASFMRTMFAAADTFYDWQPRDDPLVAQLLEEMAKRMSGFKESATQVLRGKVIGEWQQEMTAASFSPSLDLTSLPPKADPRAATVERCHESQDLQVLAKAGSDIWGKLKGDTSSNEEKKRKYFQPLLDATIKYFAAAAATESLVMQANGATTCNHNLRVLAELAGGTSITRKEFAQLEELLYLVRLVMFKCRKFWKKAPPLVVGLLTVFPPSARPNFKYPVGVLEPKKNKKRKK
ncbi:hypothetical protein PHYPSEUDO_003911 [Phytophthora pseudosyringae]|uniref:Uncharacterized protein n=1 Tax=Phytophthora pseudosyringae TaxID=221518 RepID=A0A8T1VQ45_9STRA|nr:hypothetical protein PHYPSEUDO_003911 [Phytophthora pseudosyringae]